MKAARKQYLIAAAHSRALAKISGGIARRSKRKRARLKRRPNAAPWNACIEKWVMKNFSEEGRIANP